MSCPPSASIPPGHHQFPHLPQRSCTQNLLVTELNQSHPLITPQTPVYKPHRKCHADIKHPPAAWLTPVLTGSLKPLNAPPVRNQFLISISQPGPVLFLAGHNTPCSWTCPFCRQVSKFLLPDRRSRVTLLGESGDRWATDKNRQADLLSWHSSGGKNIIQMEMLSQ